MPRRRSLARRNPQIVYMVRPSRGTEPGSVYVRAWIADDYGRMDRARPVGEASFDGAHELPRQIWYSSKDTDHLYELPPEILQGIFDYDDTIRESLRQLDADPSYAVRLFGEPSHASEYGADR